MDFDSSQTNRAPFIPVILSGGCGTRLWPLSRASHPKPFIKMQDDETLLRKTFKRIKSLVGITEIVSITNKEYYLKSQAEYSIAHDFPLSYILEPASKNTAASIALAILKSIAKYGEEAIVLILPADHLVDEHLIFSEYCEKAKKIAEDGFIVSFGIKPDKPETGYGYIQCGENISSDDAIYQIKRFIEKPSQTLAEVYVADKSYLWNAGMFCCKASVLLNEMRTYCPNIVENASVCLKKAVIKQNSLGLSVIQIQDTEFEDFENISIDYAVMERTQKGAVIACDLAWHDIGSFESYKKIFPADEFGNTVLGDVINLDSKNNLIHSENRMIALVGIENLAIIDTSDALLIADRNRTQEVKQVAEKLKEQRHETYLQHRTVIRPWGFYTILEKGTQFQIKQIVVKPHQALSLQLHQKRSEHWVVVQGEASVINGDKNYQLKTNESTFVPIGVKHRLANDQDVDLIIIEIQTGSYLGEDDIIRLEDNFGRIEEHSYVSA